MSKDLVQQLTHRMSPIRLALIGIEALIEATHAIALVGVRDRTPIPVTRPDMFRLQELEIEFLEIVYGCAIDDRQPEKDAASLWGDVTEVTSRIDATPLTALSKLYLQRRLDRQQRSIVARLNAARRTDRQQTGP